MNALVQTQNSRTAAQLAPLAAAYVLLLAIGGPILARFAEPIAGALQRLTEKRPQRVEVAAAQPVGEP